MVWRVGSVLERDIGFNLIDGMEIEGVRKGCVFVVNCRVWYDMMEDVLRKFWWGRNF